jgi:hypothetical protein
MHTRAECRVCKEEIRVRAGFIRKANFKCEIEDYARGECLLVTRRVTTLQLSHIAAAAASSREHVNHVPARTEDDYEAAERAPPHARRNSTFHFLCAISSRQHIMYV